MSVELERCDSVVHDFYEVSTSVTSYVQRKVCLKCESRCFGTNHVRLLARRDIMIRVLQSTDYSVASPCRCNNKVCRPGVARLAAARDSNHRNLECER